MMEPATCRTRFAWCVPAALLAAVSAACIVWCGGCGRGDASGVTPRADLVEIAIADDGAELDRPSVQFPHDMHTGTLAEQDKDCSTCHPTLENGYLSPLYMRTAGGDIYELDEAPEEGEDEDTIWYDGADEDDEEAGDEEQGEEGGVDVDALMELYHEHCLACHNERAAAGEKTGPVACGGCHSEEPPYVSSRVPYGMDKSLHYRHLKARDKKCEDCHHIYDEDAGKLVYKEDTESSCRDCHLEYTEENRVSFKLAAHWDCIGCHIKTAESGEDVASGPRNCGGCHGMEEQLAVEVVDEVPRLDRNQPDFVLLSAPGQELDHSRMGTVPFSHAGHEEFNSTCRVCHHKTLKACKECHTLGGTEESRGVMLQQAMHRMASDHSCVGCHDAHKADLECAGCHGLMESGRLSEHACEICHAGPAPKDLEEMRDRYTSLDDFRPGPSETKLGFTVEEIPDTVVIGTLSREYEPAVMPHRKIVNALSRYIENSRIATHFHGGRDVVCQGCHHHGSIGERPALCANCHGRPFDVRNMYRPGLYAAYHQQCLGCHQLMAMEKPRECAGCHEKKKDVDLSDDIMPDIVR